MYHMWAAQCQIQLGRSQEFNHRECRARPVADRGVELADALGRGSGRMQKGDHVLISAYPSRDGSRHGFATKVTLARH